MLLAPGKYYYILSANNPMPYNFKFKILSNGLKPDAFEFNNSASTAKEFNQRAEASIHSSSDIDFYIIHIPNKVIFDGITYFEAGIKNSDKEAEIVLFNADGTQPLKINWGTDAAFQFNSEDSGKKFLLQVRSKTNTRYEIYQSVVVNKIIDHKEGPFKPPAPNVIHE
jgi:hypothetical protein